MYWIFTRTQQNRVTPTRRLTSFFALLCTLFTVLVFQTVAAPPASAVTAFTSMFSQNIQGDIAMAANANMTCPTGCTTANSAAMVMVDVDGTPGSPLLAGGTIATFNSSSADIVVPVGSTLLYAGLFWGGNTLAGTGGVNAPTVADFPDRRGTNS
jgi:large repetitive protein